MRIYSLTRSRPLSLPLPVVADHHHLRHYSLVLEYAEAHAVKVADAGVNRSREVFPVSTLFVPPAGDGAGGHPGGNPDEPGGPGGW